LEGTTGTGFIGTSFGLTRPLTAIVEFVEYPAVVLRQRLCLWRTPEHRIGHKPLFCIVGGPHVPEAQLAILAGLKPIAIGVTFLNLSHRSNHGVTIIKPSPVIKPSNHY
jgi:hypothetical protein